MIVTLTHGAGSNSDAPVLVKVAEALEQRGVRVTRYTLPFRLSRPTGPPRRGDAEVDREAIRKQVLSLREEHPGETIIAGGHSYGGRQTSMVAAEDPKLLDGLLLLSYPLHPPMRRDQLRTDHFPQITNPVLFVHGSRDPFGLPEEMESAMELIPARKRLVLLDGAGHELTRARSLGERAAEAFTEFFDSQRTM